MDMWELFATLKTHELLKTMELMHLARCKVIPS
jgi:hypothetical protein